MYFAYLSWFNVKYFTVDKTRVVLDKIPGEEGSDYINANFIEVLKVHFLFI